MAELWNWFTFVIYLYSYPPPPPKKRYVLYFILGPILTYPDIFVKGSFSFSVVQLIRFHTYILSSRGYFFLIYFKKSIIDTIHYCWRQILGSSRSHSGDGNLNVKKAVDNLAPASDFFVHFHTVTARLRREIAWFHVLSTTWTYH